MKNKKLLTRIFALLTSLVLVLALALPCFADFNGTTWDDPVGEVVVEPFTPFSYSDTTVVDVDGWYAIQFDSLTPYSSNGTYYLLSSMLTNMADFDTAYVFYNDVYYDVYSLYYTYRSSTESVPPGWALACNYFKDGAHVSSVPGSFFANPEEVILYIPFYPPEFSDSVSESTNATVWQGVSFTVSVVNNSPDSGGGDEGGGDDENSTAGMYYQIYSILKDAIFGTESLLTGSQEYALTLISTILTYATILLPILLVIGIVVWCFKRF